MEALARNDDPITSHEAAAKVTRNGSVERNQRLCLESLRRARHGMTSAEIAKDTGIEYHEVARRMPELRGRDQAENGPRRMCTVRLNRCITWQIKGKQLELF